MASVTITWRTVGDDRVCQVCHALEGYSWTFEVGAYKFPNELTHPEFGVVWSVSGGSEAHKHTYASCRCSIESHLDLSDILVRLKRFRDTLVQSQESETSAV